MPSCPGWTVADLARHTGTIHRWATAIVDRRPPRGCRSPRPQSPWESADGWAQWLASGATPLLAALRSAGPLTPVWSWGPGRTSGWWARRMLHETTVHRADAELALGVADPVIDPVVAADGIDEFLFNLPSARRPYPHLASLPTGASLHLHATDSDGEWLIRFTDSGIAWERGHSQGDGRGPRPGGVAAAVHLRAAPGRRSAAGGLRRRRRSRRCGSRRRRCELGTAR